MSGVNPSLLPGSLRLERWDSEAPQGSNVRCVGASVQMLLDFYRYEYTQVRLAQELGLGTVSDPNGLPYSAIGSWFPS